MRRSIFAVLAALTLGGCATVPRTTTYQTTEWREVEEQQPSIQTMVPNEDFVPTEAEVVQPVKEIVTQANVPTTFPEPKKERKYHRLGGPNAFNPNRAPKSDEIRVVLPKDAFAIIDDRNNKLWQAWLHAGTWGYAAPTVDPNFYRVTWVEECGNSVLNPDHLAIFIKVKREVVSPRPIAKKSAVPPFKVVQVPQPPVKRWVPVTVERTRVLTCHERKQMVPWYGKIPQYLLAAGGGYAGAVFGGKTGAGLGAGGGRLIGGFFDGTWCADGDDVLESAFIGITAYSVAPTDAPRAVGSPSHPLPGNGGGNTLPGNGGSTIYAPPVNPVTGHSLPIN